MLYRPSGPHNILLIPNVLTPNCAKWRGMKKHGSALIFIKAQVNSEHLCWWLKCLRLQSLNNYFTGETLQTSYPIRLPPHWSAFFWKERLTRERFSCNISIGPTLFIYRQPTHVHKNVGYLTSYLFGTWKIYHDNEMNTNKSQRCSTITKLFRK